MKSARRMVMPALAPLLRSAGAVGCDIMPPPRCGARRYYGAGKSRTRCTAFSGPPSRPERRVTRRPPARAGLTQVADRTVPFGKEQALDPPVGSRPIWSLQSIMAHSSEGRAGDPTLEVIPSVPVCRSYVVSPRSRMIAAFRCAINRSNFSGSDSGAAGTTVERA
jgi:hypothetical protein